MTRTPSLRRLWAGAFIVMLLAAIPALAEREDFHKNYAVAPDVQVSVDNVNGRIEISGWDRNEVDVSAAKSADSAEKLNRLKIEVDASSGRVSIRTRLPQGINNNPGSVEYRIRVPRTARIDKIEAVNGSVEISTLKSSVRAHSVNGSVTGRALTGDIDLGTVNGSVNCEALDFANARSVKLSSVNGAVEIYMPRDGSAHLTASTVHGGIHSDFSLPIKRGFVGSNLDTTIGSGATHVDLSSVNGGISIHGGTKGI